MQSASSVKSVSKKLFIDKFNPQIIIRLLSRWCWNWQTGVVEGHVPLGRAGSTPAQRIKKTVPI